MSKVTSFHVITAATMVFGIDRREMMSRSRVRRCVVPRHVAIAATRIMTGASILRIGQAFRRDHTTVLNSIKFVSENRESVADKLKAVMDTAELLAAKQIANMPEPKPPTIPDKCKAAANDNAICRSRMVCMGPGIYLPLGMVDGYDEEETHHHKRHSADVIEAVRKLAEEDGLTITQIAGQSGLRRGQVKGIVIHHGIRLRRRPNGVSDGADT